MTGRLPLPARPLSPTAQAVMDALEQLLTPVPDTADLDAHYQRVSDARHLWIRAEALWEQALEDGREAVRGAPPHDRRTPGQFPKRGLPALAEGTGVSAFTAQMRIKDRRSRVVDEARQAAEAARAQPRRGRGGRPRSRTQTGS